MSPDFSASCVEAIRWVQSMGTFVITFLVMVAIVMIYNACPNPAAHPAPKKKDSYELCKLHQRRLDECGGMHDQPTDEPPGWTTCGQRGCLIVPPHDHKEDA